MRLSLSASLFLSAFVALPAFAAEKDEDAASGRAVIREMNLARQNPTLYATFVQELRSQMSGRAQRLQQEHNYISRKLQIPTHPLPLYYTLPILETPKYLF